ncbi:MAG TPA: DUF4430 domain-containing protein [Gaiellaceae bacterium]
MRSASLLCLVVLSAGCGSQTRSGLAVVWVTRDRGAQVLRVGKVPAGLSAIQGLERVAKVETRYGGRYVRSVDGVSEHGQRAWFYYVNGYLADRSGGDYRLRPGDVEWWDYRPWSNPAQDPLVVGAFPQPFVNGYDGHSRHTVIVTSNPALVRALARRLHATVAPPGGAALARDVNVISVEPGAHTAARLTYPGSTSPGSPVRLDVSGDPQVLLRRWPFRFRYSLP